MPLPTTSKRELNTMSDEEVIEPSINDQLVMISGESASGKSASLRKIKDQEGVMYLCAEAGKRLPFRNKFETYVISDPLQVYEAMDHAETRDDIHTIVIDSLTFLMDMYESVYVLPAKDTMQAWGQFAQYFKNLMQAYVSVSSKTIIFTAHTKTELEGMEMKTYIPVKGSLKNNGIEAYFSTVVSAKRVSLKALEPYGSSMLNITEEEIDLGFKHVFQTKLTKDTVGERIRSPMGMFSKKETFIDNDCELLLAHLRAYYA